MSEEQRQDESVVIPKITYEGNDRDLKEQVIHYEKGTHRIVVFTIVGLLMGWFSYQYYGENFLPLKIILAIPYKCSEMLHEAFHPPIYAQMGMMGCELDKFFPQAPYVSILAEYGTAALFGGAVYGSLAYFTGDKRIFTLTKYVKFGCVWAAVIAVWTAALFGVNHWQVKRNDTLQNISSMFINGDWGGRAYPAGSIEGQELIEAFYEGEGPVVCAVSERKPEEEYIIEFSFGVYRQGQMSAWIHPEKGYLVTDQGTTYQMTEAFMEQYRVYLEEENHEQVAN